MMIDTGNSEEIDMLLDREQIVQALDHGLISVVALRIGSEGKEIAIVLKEIEEAMDAAYDHLSR